MHRIDSPSQARFGSGDLEVALLDLDEALRNLGGDEDLLCEIAKVFVDDVPALARDLEIAFDQSDYRSARLIAHSLKGLCATFGAEPARSRAQTLEHLFADGVGSTVSAADIHSLATALDDTIHLLRSRVIPDC
ncbi:MAG: Hpt domain-containing protein [Pirellulales bacterium]